MAGVGMWDSNGKEWRPARVKIRLSSTDKNDVTPPKYLIDPATGKEMEQWDPAAVESIKQMLGLKVNDPITMEQMKMDVARYDAENEAQSLAKTVDKLAGVIERIAAPGAAPATRAQK